MHSEHGAKGSIRNPASAAKYVHEQCVRTVRAIQLSPSPARAGRCPTRTGMDLREPAHPFRIGANVPVRCGIEISVLVVFGASEDDAGRLSSGQFVQRSGGDRDLLTANAEFAPQGFGSWHLILLESLPAHAEHLSQPRLQNCLSRALTSPIQPVFKILNS